MAYTAIRARKMRVRRLNVAFQGPGRSSAGQRGTSQSEGAANTGALQQAIFRVSTQLPVTHCRERPVPDWDSVTVGLRAAADVSRQIRIYPQRPGRVFAHRSGFKMHHLPQRMDTGIGATGALYGYGLVGELV